ncbi:MULTISPECIES: single-stranded DNA-binding protein [Bacillati]|uniref:single-stranded DNA-binding protein n=1 Tax=Bacillati TaxID=1783272 RepID=UPI00365DEDBE
MNQVCLVGRLTKDPDFRKTPNGVSVTSFSLAVKRPFAKEGDVEADFPNCVAWNKTADNVANFLKKGSLCSVVGSIQTRKYQKDGNTVYVTEVRADSVQFLEPKNSSGDTNRTQNGNYGRGTNYNNNGQGHSNHNNHNNQDYNNNPFGNGHSSYDEELPF